MSASLILMIAVALFFSARGILSHNRLFEFPTLAALLYLAFFVPQALAAERNVLLQTYDPWILWFYMAVSLILLAVGFDLGKRIAFRRASKSTPAPLRSGPVVIGTALLALIGLYAITQVTSLAETANAQSSSWTGEITAWYLLMQATFFAFGLACLGCLRFDRNKILLIIGIITFFTIVTMVNSNVKRSMVAEFFIILAGCWFFVKFRQPPRVVVLIGCLAGMVLLHQVGAVRDYVGQNRGNAIEAVIEGVPFRDFRYFTYDESPEVQQAVVDIYSANQTGTYLGPINLWNRTVHQYVPAFLVGRRFKESLMIDTQSAGAADYRLESFERTGATRTGFSDTYRSYQEFGVLIFMLIGMFMGWLYGMAVRHRFWAQFYYLILINDGLMAFTESTDRFLVTLPFTVALTIAVVVPWDAWRKKLRTGQSFIRPFRPNRRSWQQPRPRTTFHAR